MCHLVLLMPVIALPIFWLLSPGYSIPIYIFTALSSGLLYWQIVKSMRNQPATGAEGLVGMEAEVVSRLSTRANTGYLVRSSGELMECQMFGCFAAWSSRKH